MKLTVSNIAWEAHEEAAIAAELQKLGVKYVEIAPTKIWDDPLNVTDDQIKKYKEFWAKHGIKIVAFQSMLFGKLELTLFDDAKTREKTKVYLEKFIELAARTGAEVLVFGSPKNRQVKNISQKEAFVIAKDFFSGLGKVAHKHGVYFCIEPNAKDYDCNFITTAAEGLNLVKHIKSPGFCLHLDAANMSMEGDDPSISTKAHEWLRHFHISAPFLEKIEEKIVNHTAMANALRAINYPHHVSIEMRPRDDGKNIERVRNAVLTAQKYYYA